MKLTPKQLEVVLGEYRQTHYSELNSADFSFLMDQGIINGYGGAGTNPIVKFLIGIICRKFKEANANRHDFGFWIGGDLKKFHECNTKFYYAMQRDAQHIEGWRKYYFLFVALLAYLAVELFGKKYFNFTNKSV